MRIKRWCATNDPFEPDWSDKEQAKMEIFYNNERKCFNWCISYYTQGIAEIPYLSSSKKAKEFIKEMEDDLRLVFNV